MAVSNTETVTIAVIANAHGSGWFGVAGFVWLGFWLDIGLFVDAGRGLSVGFTSPTVGVFVVSVGFRFSVAG